MPSIDVGTGGTGGTCLPLDFAVNKELPFLFSENVPFFLRKSVLEASCPPKFETLPMPRFSSVQFSSYILITPLYTIYNQKNYKDIQQCAKEINTRIHCKNDEGIKNEKVGKNCMHGIT